MNYYLIAGILCLVAIFALLAALLVSMKKTLYRFRNVGLIGALIAVATGVAALVIDLTVHGANSNSGVDFLLLLERFPDSFAHLVVRLFVFLCILMFVSNISLIKHEGMSPKNMVGTFLNALFILSTVAIYWISRLLTEMDLSAYSSIVSHLSRLVPMYIYCLLDYTECIMLGIILMGWIAANQKPKYDKDFIIIPGCSISKTGGLLPLLRGRTTRAIRYAWEQEIATGRKVCYIPSGGQGPDEVISEGSAMGLYLLSHSAEEDEVYPEKQSTNTYENFAFSKRIADELNPDAKLAFATTNYHMLRCGMLAWDLGMDAEGIASGTKWYFWPNGFAREVVAIFKMTTRYHFMAAAVILIWCMLITAL